MTDRQCIAIMAAVLYGAARIAYEHEYDRDERAGRDQPEYPTFTDAIEGAEEMFHATPESP